MSDCHEYGKQVCQAPYIPWAKENCEQYCEFCGHGITAFYFQLQNRFPIPNV